MTGKYNTTRMVATVLSIILASAIALPTQVARAASITVDSTSDGTGGPGCTLRDAILAADTDTAKGGCPQGSGADTIVLASGEIYALTEGTLPAIHSPITIEGNGSNIERSSAAATNFRIFYISEYGDGDLTLNEVTVSDGVTSPGEGGGIKNWGKLTMNYSSVSGNTGCGIITLGGSSVYIYNSNISNNSGCGISNNRGSVVIENSTISGNYDANRGGGISNYLGSVAINNSTINGNSAILEGGGIRNRGVLLLTNSTVSGNTSDGTGGGIWNYEDSTVIHSTISNNEASAGSGIYNHGSGTVDLANTIIGSQLSGQNCAGVPVTSLGYNLDSDGSCNLSGPGDLSGVDPLLGSLADNGGPTQTHALLGGSPAINAVPATSCALATDQRGISRPQGPACDIGAFEVEYQVVDIDIKPGSDPNCFNSDGHGVIPVAVLGSPNFDASFVDPFTTSLDGADVRVKGKSGSTGSLEDVNGDGFLDLVIQIVDEAGYVTGDTTANFNGFTFDGIHIMGSDSICIRPPE